MLGGDVPQTSQTKKGQTPAPETAVGPNVQPCMLPRDVVASCTCPVCQVRIRATSIAAMHILSNRFVRGRLRQCHRPAHTCHYRTACVCRAALPRQDIMVMPTCTPCGHSFCGVCMDSWLESTVAGRRWSVPGVASHRPSAAKFPCPARSCVVLQGAEPFLVAGRLRVPQVPSVQACVVDSAQAQRQHQPLGGDPAFLWRAGGRARCVPVVDAQGA